MRTILAIFLERRRTTLFWVCLLFAVGGGIGWLMAWTLPPTQTQLLKNELAHYSLWAGQAPPTNSLALLRQALTQDLVCTAGIITLAALSLLGTPVVLLLVGVRGFVLGFTSGLFTQPLGWHSPLVIAAFLLPHNLLIIPGLILLAVAALSLSKTTLQILLGHRSDTSYGQQLLATLLMTLVTSGMIAMGDLLQAFVSPYLLAVVNRFWP